MHLATRRESEPTIHVRTGPYGLRVGMFTDTGPYTRMGHNTVVLASRPRRMRTGMQLAGGACLFLAGVICGLYKTDMSSIDSSDAKLQALAGREPQVLTDPQLDRRISELLQQPPSSGSQSLRASRNMPWQLINIGSRVTEEDHVQDWERQRMRFATATTRQCEDPQIGETVPLSRMVPASSSPPTNAESAPISGQSSDTPATVTQGQSRTPSEQARVGEVAANAERAREPDHVRISEFHPPAQPQRERPNRKHAQRHQGSITDTLAKIFRW